MATTPIVTSDGYQATYIAAGPSTGSINYPGTPSEGDLIVIYIAGFVSWNGNVTGFTQITSAAVQVWVKKAGASEGTSAGYTSLNFAYNTGAIAFFVEAGTWYEDGALTNTVEGTTTNSHNCPSHTTTWPAQENLWFAVGQADGGTVGTLSGYTVGATASSGAPDNHEAKLATRNTDPVSDTENPATWSGGSAPSERSGTYVIRGAVPSGGSLFFGPGF